MNEELHLEPPPSDYERTRMLIARIIIAQLSKGMPLVQVAEALADETRRLSNGGYDEYIRQGDEKTSL
jgi:hypothetical protein